MVGSCVTSKYWCRTASECIFLKVVNPASQKVLSEGCEPRISENTFWRLCTPHLREYFLKVVYSCISESTFWRLCTLHLRKYFLEVVYPASQKVLSGGCVPRISESTF
jgi:hypothetical protein